MYLQKNVPFCHQKVSLTPTSKVTQFLRKLPVEVRITVDTSLTCTSRSLLRRVFAQKRTQAAENANSVHTASVEALGDMYFSCVHHLLLICVCVEGCRVGRACDSRVRTVVGLTAAWTQDGRTFVRRKRSAIGT